MPSFPRVSELFRALSQRKPFIFGRARSRASFQGSYRHLQFEPLESRALLSVLVGKSISAATARDGQLLTMEYQLSSSVAMDVMLQANLIGPGGQTASDPYRDTTVHVIPGTQWYSRSILVNLPPNAPTGLYDVVWKIHGAPSGDESLTQTDYLRINSPVAVRVPILMYHDVAPTITEAGDTTPAMLRADIAAL